MRKALYATVLLILILPAAFAAEQENAQASPRYNMGTQMFTFRAGPVFPLFTFYYNTGEYIGSESMRMHTGGYGSIRYQSFLNETFAIGGELGYAFSYSLSDLFTAVPIQAVLTWIPVQSGVEIPLSIGLGVSYNSYGSSTLLTPIATLETGLAWYFTDNWGIEFSAGYWLIPELYLDPSDSKWDDSSLANFMPATISIIYRN